MDNVKLPETVEEFQRALRNAFEAGAWWQKQNFPRKEDKKRTTIWSGEDVRAETRRRYPVRKKVRRTWSGELGEPIWRVSRDGRRIVYTTHSSSEDDIEPMVTLTEDRLRAWGDLLANPYKEVDE